MSTGTLHLFCGKMAAGKSTLARDLAAETGGFLVREDELTDLLWPGELTSLEIYVDLSARLRRAFWPVITRLLVSGCDVILDFPANTRGQRKVLMELVTGSGAAHVLHYLEASDRTCKARLALRNDASEHEYSPTEEHFYLFTAYFTAPSEEEGFTVRVWPQEQP